MRDDASGLCRRCWSGRQIGRPIGRLIGWRLAHRGDRGPERPGCAVAGGAGADRRGELPARGPGGDVARKHGATRWQVYDWCKRLRDGRLSLPEEVAEQPRFARLLVEAPEPPAAPRPAARSCIQVEVSRIVIRVGAEADEAHLARVIRAARAACG